MILFMILKQRKLFAPRALISFLCGPFLVGVILLLLPNGFTTAFMSPIDEGAHMDYAIHLAHGQIPSWSSKFTQEELRIGACMGSFRSKPGDCALENRDPNLLPPNGWSYEAQQAPIGYIPAVIGWTVTNASSKAPQTQARILRLSNLFWLCLAGLLFSLVVFLSNYTFWQTFLAAILLGSNATIVNSYSYYTNDSAVLPMTILSILIFILTKKWMDSSRVPIKSALIMNFIIGVVLGLTKEVLIISPLIILVASVRSQRKDVNKTKNSLRIATAQTLGCGITFALYTASLDIFSKTKSSTVYSALLGFSTGKNPFPTIYRSLIQLPQVFLAELNSFSGWIILIFIIVLTLAVTKNQTFFGLTVKEIILSTLIVGGLSSIIFTLDLYFIGGYLFTAPVRYMISIISIMALVAPLGLEKVVGKVRNRKEKMRLNMS